MLNLKIPLLVCLLASSASAQMAIELEKMNALYPACADNNFTLVVNDIPDSNLILIPSLGNIEHTGEGKYRWDIITRDTNLATLEVWDRLADTLLRRSTYRVKPLPEPYPRLSFPCNEKEGIGVGLKSANGLKLYSDQLSVNLPCDIISYEIHYLSNGNKTIIKNSGPLFENSALNLISEAKAPYEIYFNNIKYTCGCDPMIRFMEAGRSYRRK